MALSTWKITYVTDDESISFYHNAYFEKFVYVDFHMDVVNYIVSDRKFKDCAYKLYWIDSAGDKVEISSDCDMVCFRKYAVEPYHLLVTPIADEKKKKVIPEDKPLEGFVHKRVSCDGCNLAEIVGFRYKCLQCPNYDLCENCEAKHKHSEHIMLRMPKDDVRKEMLKLNKFGNLRIGGGCPFGLIGNNTQSTATQHPEKVCPMFVEPRVVDPPTTSAPAEKSKEETAKKPARCPASANGLAKFIGMLNDLAEGGNMAGNVPQPNSPPQPDIQSESVNLACMAAREASKYAGVAAKAAADGISMFANMNNNAAAVTANNEPKEPTAATTANGSETVTSNAPNVVAGVENLTQLIEPQYMRQGIQILNNFSDLIGKMLDSMDTVGNSASGATSSVDSNEATATTTTENRTESSNVEQQLPNNVEINKEPQEQQPKEGDESDKENTLNDTSRASSIEDEWQLIGEQQQPQQQKQIHIIEQLPTNEMNAATAADNYQQVSILFRQQVHEANNSGEKERSNNENNNNNNNNNNTPIVYHSDEQINAAVIRMMAMGFSNEGGCLTQLLDSVRGDISRALDLLDARPEFAFN